LFPAARTLLFSVNAAVAVVPCPARVAEPSALLPRANVILPDGGAFPLVACTVTVRTVAEDELLRGVTETVVVVAMGDGVTVTIAEAEDPAKFPGDT
jgi:hypothetical protein